MAETDAPTDQSVGAWVMATNTASMAPPSGAPPPLPRRRMPTISVQVWNEQRPRFQKYYVDLDMSLPKAMKKMEETYAFYASEKQYKTKIKQWKITKYVNEDKMDCMLRKAKRRKTQYGKDTAFRLNGREVENEKLDRFQKRRKLHSDEIGSSTVSTVSRIDYYTPSGQGSHATQGGHSSLRAGSETSSISAPSTIGSGSHSTNTSDSVLLRLSWDGLDMRALRDMETRARTPPMNENPTEALDILRQVLAGYEYLLGPDVDDVLAVVELMAYFCGRLGNDSEAEVLWKRAVSGYEMIHGLEDRRTLFSVAELARLYGIQGRFEDSVVLFNRAAKGLEHMLPFSHLAIRVFSDLATTYQSQGLLWRAKDCYKRVVAGYLGLGPGHEDDLWWAEVNLCFTSFFDRDPATESLLINVLTKCEVRYAESPNAKNHEHVFVMLAAMCWRCWHFKDFEGFELYNQRLIPILPKIFEQDSPRSNYLFYCGTMVARVYSEMGRYEKAESLFIRLKSRIDEGIRSLLTGHANRLERNELFEMVRLHAEHYIRQSMWEDAEPLLLKASALEGPFCRPYDSQELVRAFENFRIESGREAGALPLAQRTPATHMQSFSSTGGQTVEDANRVNSVGSAAYLQPLEESDWLDFPLPSQSTPSLFHWSPQQSPSPTVVIQAEPWMECENSDMRGVHDILQ